MSLTYLSHTLTEQEYLKMRFKQAPGTGRVTRAAINTAKLFCQDQYNKELITLLADIRAEVEKTHHLDIALIFLQKMLNWASEDHPNVRTSGDVCHKQGKPFGKKKR